MADDDTMRARASEDPVVLQHENLKSITERVRIAWSSDERQGKPNKRAARAVREQLREFTPLANAKLIDLMCNGETHAVQLGAVKEFYDRCYGKARETIEIDDKRDNDAAKMIDALASLRKNPDTAAALMVLAEASAQPKRD